MPRLTPLALHHVRSLSRALVTLALFACTAVAYAQEPEGERAHKTAARELFAEGIELVDAERWTEAEDRFRRALAFRASPVIAFNLASVLAKQAQLTEASELLHGVLRDPEAPVSVREPAAALLAELEPRLAKLTVEVQGAAPGDSITLDGRELRDAELGVALPIDPGVHSLVALREEERIVSDSVTVAEGSSERVLLDLPALEADLASPPPVAHAATSDPYTEPWEAPAEESDGGGSWLLWTGVGVGAVAVAVLAVVIATGSAKTKTEEPFAGDFEPPSLRVVVAP